VAAGLTDQDWRIRLAIYRSFVANGRPPTYRDLARELGIPAEEMRLTYHRLHEGHAVFLDPGTDTIRMANPLSAIPTPFQVHVDGRRL
jgi:hypothetical protein